MTKLSNEELTPHLDGSLRVVVMEGGPYMVYGKVPLTQQFIISDEMGESWSYRQGADYTHEGDEPVALCRCGASGSKPFCDGTHTRVAWTSELTAPMEGILSSARVLEGEDLILTDNEQYCVYARFCHPGGGAWRLTKASADPTSRDLAIREASMCPSARLMAWSRGADNPYEFDFSGSISLLEDPAIECSGGVWLRGGIPVEREDGTRYEVRNRVVLCRCGASGNKPYCDGAHAAVHWSDEMSNTAEGELFPDGELEIEDVSRIR